MGNFLRIGLLLAFSLLINAEPVLAQVSFDTLIKEARTHVRQSEYKLAREKFNRAIKQNSKRTVGLLALANAQYRDTEYHDALDTLTHLLKNEPQNSLAQEKMGLIYHHLEEYVKSIAWFEQALEISPTSSLFYHRGRSYARLKDYQSAIQDYSRAIEIQPKELYYIKRGHLYKKISQTQAAIDDFNQAIALYPRSYRAYRYRGDILAWQGKHDQAMVDFKQAIKLKPDYADSYVGRARIYHARGQYELALQDFSQAIEISPTWAWPYYHRAQTYQAIGEENRAQADLDKACDLGYCRAENFWLRLLIALVVLFFSFKFFNLVSTVLFNYFLIFQEKEYSLVELESVSKDQRLILEHGEEFLLPLGFEFCGAMHVNDEHQIGKDGIYYFLFYHSAHKVFALAEVKAFYKFPLRFSFYTAFDDSSIMVTRDYDQWESRSPSWYQFQFANVKSVAELLNAHLERLETSQRSCIDLSVDKMAEILQQQGQETQAQQLRDGILVAKPDKQSRYTLYGAYYDTKILLQRIKNAADYGDAEKKKFHPHALVEAYYMLAEYLQLVKRKRSATEKLILFFISFIVFCISFGLMFTWEIVPVLAAVILVHELGHYVMMRRFSYKNTSIVFVPLLGAVAMGEDHGVGFYQKLVVYLAGPLPGIVMAFVFMSAYLAFPSYSILLMAALMSLIINYFNLLPVYPLDGGRVLELMATRNSSYVLIILAFMSMACFLVLFSYLSFNYFSVIILAVLFWIAYGQWKMIRLTAAIGLDHITIDRTADRKNIMKAEFDRIGEADPEKAFFFLSQLGVLDHALQSICRSSPSTKQIVIGGMIYATSFFLPLYILLEYYEEFSPYLINLFN